MTDQNTEFEVIIDRHDGDEDYFLSGHVKPEGAWQLAHADRATLIGMVKSERARADKAELARVLDASGTREWWLRMSKLQAATTHPKEQDNEQ